MPGINTGVLTNAYPLTAEQIKELEREVLDSNTAYVYLDENSKLSFMMPQGIEGIKDLAWDHGYELGTDADGFVKKVYAKTGLKTFALDKVLSKQNINDDWSESEQLEGTGSEYYTLAPTALSFRSTEPLNEFQEVRVNGQTVDPANYTLEEGSTIVKLSIDYLKTLDTGNHEVAIVSQNKTVSGEFTVAAPELNEYGFYYNQPYSLYLEGFGNLAFFLREDNTVDLINIDFGQTDIGSFAYRDGGLIIEFTTGTYTCFVRNSEEIYCNELMTSATVGNEIIVSDRDYIYSYHEELGGYAVDTINKTKEEYADIKSNINGISIVKLSNFMFAHMEHTTGAVYGNDYINNIHIPSTVTIIGESAFGDCDGLTNITIPSSVSSIGVDAFCLCRNLTNITFEGTVAQWNAITKGNNWRQGVPATHVHCIDGDVEL